MLPHQNGIYKNAFSIKLDEHVMTYGQVIADHFHKFFVNVASKLKHTLKPSKFEKLNNFIYSKVTDVSFDIPLINSTFVSSFLSCWMVLNQWAWTA